MNPDRNDFTVRFSGEKADDAGVVGEMLTALDGLFGAVAEAQGIDPESVSLKVGRIRWVCDGCESERPDNHADWIRRDGLDYCPACQGGK